MHDAPVKELAWIPEMNLLVTGSWDKTLRWPSIWITFTSLEYHRCFTYLLVVYRYAIHSWSMLIARYCGLSICIFMIWSALIVLCLYSMDFLFNGFSYVFTQVSLLCCIDIIFYIFIKSCVASHIVLCVWFSILYISPRTLIIYLFYHSWIREGCPSIQVISCRHVAFCFSGTGI